MFIIVVQVLLFVFQVFIDILYFLVFFTVSSLNPEVQESYIVFGPFLIFSVVKNKDLEEETKTSRYVKSCTSYLYGVS